MYESHFDLRETPFSIAPDPAFLYLSEGHKEALAHLLYGFSHGGFVLITGEVGTGKTTLLRNLVAQTPDDLDVAFVLNPRLTARELLETICGELGVARPDGAALTVKDYIDALNRHLLATHAQGRGTVVIIDEAQNLSPAVLEQIRLLTNLETNKRKLLRIILIGQPELGELLSRTELRQLAQRITARYHLRGLSREDTYAYVIHRLSRAGGNPHLFSRTALRQLHRISRGIPRVINLVADRALLGAYVEGRHRVSGRLVRRAAREVLGAGRPLRRWLVGGAAAATAAGVAYAYLLWPIAPALNVSEPEGPAVVEAGPAELEPAVPSLVPEAPPPAGSGTASREAGETAPGPAETPPATTVTLRPPDLPAFRTQRMAYRAVLDRWDADLSSWREDTIPCNFAPSVGLQCLSRTGSWSDIRRLGLPVVLELWGQGATPYYAAVIRMREGLIDLLLADQAHRVPPAALQDIWYGSYVVLWRMPPDYHGTLKRGDRHPSVAWLRDRLADLGADLGPAVEPGLFDAALQDAVLTFQRDHGLLTDGVVGPATWISLSRQLALPAPSLEG